MTIKLHFKHAGSEKVIKFMDLKLPFCDVLSKTMVIPLARDIISEIRKAGNFPFSCPLKGNFLYFVKNLTLSKDILPSYAPPGVKFNFTFELIDNENYMGEIKVQGSTRRIYELSKDIGNIAMDLDIATI
ncbi:uncharacterized protein LOC142239488 [Haematobia irritans]|uniref:uncharacterized protein LOC142239488 n=1 Tax=Haematobia irritans TaxID=7368 RepID=UPI003F4FACF2